MEVAEGVPSVSTQCPGLLRVLEPSQRGAPSRLSPCQPSSRKQLSRRLTVASAADRHLLIVDLPHDIDAVQHYLEFHFTFVRVYYLTTVEGKEFLPRSSLCNLDFKAGSKTLLGWGSAHCVSTTSVVLLPCAVSSTRTWVNQPLTRVHNRNGEGTTTYSARPWVT